MHRPRSLRSIHRRLSPTSDSEDGPGGWQSSRELPALLIMPEQLAELEPVRRALLESEAARREASRVLDALSEALLSIESAASESSAQATALARSETRQVE